MFTTESLTHDDHNVGDIVHTRVVLIFKRMHQMQSSTSLDTITYKSFSVTGPPWSLYVTDTRADIIDQRKLLLGWSPS